VYGDEPLLMGTDASSSNVVPVRLPLSESNRYACPPGPERVAFTAGLVPDMVRVTSTSTIRPGIPEAVSVELAKPGMTSGSCGLMIRPRGMAFGTSVDWTVWVTGPSSWLSWSTSE
jgi:hypothetical protein